VHAEDGIFQGNPGDLLLAAHDNHLGSQEGFLLNPYTLKPGWFKSGNSASPSRFMV
jgi:hypothetical protein